MAAFDFSPSFAGINGALLNLGKRLEEDRNTEATLAAFDASQRGGTAQPRLTQPSTPAAPALGGGDYFGRTRGAESSGDDAAKNPASTATGRYQFLRGTWDGLAKSNPELGLTPDGRTDPQQQDRAMRAFTAQNAEALRAQKIDPTDRNLYMTHFLGAGAAPNFISAVQQDPSVPAASLVDARVAAANRPVFFNPDGTSRSAGEVYQRMTNRFGDGSTAIAALGGGSAPAPVQIAQAGTATQADVPAPGAAEAQGFAIPGGQPASQPVAQPATRENINGGMIRTLLANPGTRDIGKALWQQALTGKQYGFQIVGDQLYRTNPSTGAVEPVGITNPKADAERRLTEINIQKGQRELDEKKLTTFSTPDGTTYSFDPATGQTTPVASGAKPNPKQSIKGEDGTLYSFDPESGNYVPQVKSGPKSEDVTGLRKEFQNLPSYKNLAQAAPVYNSMLEAAGRDNRAADVNMIYGFAKVMDPGSVVRESEMSVAQAIATLPQQLQTMVASQLASSGRLSPEVRAAIMQEARSRVLSYKGMVDKDVGQFGGILERRGMNRADILPDFGEFPAFVPPKKGGATKTSDAVSAQTPAGDAAPVKPGSVTVPPSAVQFLRANPNLAADFDAKYGAGVSQRILRGQ